MNMWIQHVQHLLRIARNRHGHDTGPLQSFILWYVLYLDTISSLVGTGSGGFVEAFLKDEISIPDWRVASSPRTGEQLQPNEETVIYRAVFDFSKNMCRQCAKMSQLAARLRSEDSMQNMQGRATRHVQIQQCANELYEVWNLDYPGFLSRDIAQASAQLPSNARIIYEHVCHPIFFPAQDTRLTASAGRNAI